SVALLYVKSIALGQIQHRLYHPRAAVQVDIRAESVGAEHDDRIVDYLIPIAQLAVHGSARPKRLIKVMRQKIRDARPDDSHHRNGCGAGRSKQHCAITFHAGYGDSYTPARCHKAPGPARWRE